MDQAVCCYRHQDRATGVRCSRCERPICPECMVSASVGFHCPECVRADHQVTSRPRTVAGGVVTANPRLVTLTLIGINIAVFLAVQVYGDSLIQDLILFGGWPPGHPVTGVAEGQYYRLLTTVFLHQQLMHIGFNMLSLWWVGPGLEAALGRARYLALYLISGIGGSALSFLLASPYSASLGASGAIFGLLGATFVLMRRLRYDLRPIIAIIVLNLIFTFSQPEIDWRAHVGGLVTGAVIAYGMVHAPRRHRALVQWGTCAAMCVVIAGVVIAGTLRING
jgi:membrane associated rhomboid family serine protease